MGKKVHVISHSHWDREWYMPFEYHRARLIHLIDDCLELFEKNKNYKHFHLDGHTALVEDYLEIKPENLEKIKKYVREGRFSVGPWYVLQDEFLTSSEANIRNLLVGTKEAEELGSCCPVGYFPDAFGNVGQMPQILSQAGMQAIVFGRGIKSIGVNNSLLPEKEFDSCFSELYWESPDGTRLPGIFFANWYNNGVEIPKKNVKEYWAKTLSDMEKYSSTDELLLMNGSDHQPVQRDLDEAIEEAEKAYPDYHFIHSNFRSYAEAIKKEMSANASVVRGELTSRETDGWCTLINTASSNIILKMMNRRGEQLLETAAEPLSVIAANLGKPYPKELLLYAWKTLLKNHAHDSICGCSCDEVNEEVRMRFIKSRQAAEVIVKDNLEYIAQCIDVSAFEGCSAAFSVINTYGKEKTGVVSINVDVQRLYGTDVLHKSAEHILKSAYQGEYKLVDEEGREIVCSVSKPNIAFGFELPDDMFRKPYMAEQVCVTFEAEHIPPMGYKTYGLYRTDGKVKGESLVTAQNTMENKNLRVTICSDGTIEIYDKFSGRTYPGLLKYEDVADIGNEYTFVPSPGDIPIYSGSEMVEITLIEDNPFRAEYQIKTVMKIPKSADEMLEVEKKTFAGIKNRTAGRSSEYISIAVETFVTLEKNSKGVRIKSVIDNKAKDHRMRVYIPTGIACDTHKVESIFEVVERQNEHKMGWIYPSGCDRQQGFVMMQDERAGIAVANIGLYEYEILKDCTIALTLIRSVGEMGDWGVFPTENSQCLQKMEFAYEIVPYTHEEEAYTELAGFQYNIQCVQNFKLKNPIYQNGMLEWEGKNLRMTAFKYSCKSEDIIMRWVNYSNMEQILKIKKSDWIRTLYRSNVMEKKGEYIEAEDGKWYISIKPYEILTLGVSRNAEDISSVKNK